MWGWLEKIPYSVLILVSVFMLLAPFWPMPHVVEKLLMLKNGTLKRPLDIFDLIFHTLPAMVLLIKLARDYWGNNS